MRTGPLFRAFLKVVDHCPACGEDFTHHRADDAPAYFNIVIVGHIVVPLALAVETAFAPAYWVHVALWLPLMLILSFGLMQPIKGAIVAWQWAHRMHGFDPEAERDDLHLRHSPQTTSMTDLTKLTGDAREPAHPNAVRRMPQR